MNRYNLCVCGGRKKEMAKLCLACHRKSRPLEMRFWEKVNKNGATPQYRPDLGPCWLWTGVIGSHGYGEIHVGGERKMITAPHASLKIHGVMVPKGFVPDHLCDEKRCVRISHFQIVSQAVNILRANSAPAINSRKTECDYGHPFSKENTHIYRGHRRCKACWTRTRALYRNQRNQYMRDRRLRLKRLKP